MPQVDAVDLPWMLSEAQASRGWYFDELEPEVIKSHQIVNHGRALGMPEKVAMKPILISSDNFVVDGNHRLYNRKMKKGALTKMLVIKLSWSFDEALDWLLEQPFTYTINPHTHERN